MSVKCHYFAAWLGLVPKPLPSVTRKVYNLATRVRVAKKRALLDAWAIELRRIVGEPVAERRLAA